MFERNFDLSAWLKWNISSDWTDAMALFRLACEVMNSTYNTVGSSELSWSGIKGNSTVTLVFILKNKHYRSFKCTQNVSISQYYVGSQLEFWWATWTRKEPSSQFRTKTTQNSTHIRLPGYNATPTDMAPSPYRLRGTEQRCSVSVELIN